MAEFKKDTEVEIPKDGDGRWQPNKNWKPTIDKPMPSVRCTEPNEKGMQCQNFSMNGSLKCASHSGPADMKEAQGRVQASRLRLIGMVDPALDVLEELLQPGTADAVRLKAVENVLDRGGLTKGQDINVSVQNQNQGAAAVAEKLEAIRARKIADNEVIEVTEVEEENDA